MTARLPELEESVVVAVGDRAIRLSLCAYMASGIRCGFAGTISHTTLNSEGSTWWCRYHFDCRDPKFGAMVVTQSHEQGMRRAT